MQEMDIVIHYARSRELDIRPKTVIVEGTTDVKFFKLAGRLEKNKTGIRLFDEKFSIVASGEREQGGARGVIRELNALRSMSNAYLMPNGRPKYRFIGLFDNDKAGRRAINDAHSLDLTILEYRDTFRLHPIMPRKGNLDPKTLRQAFDSMNDNFNGLDWELEDLLSENFIASFLSEYPNALCDEKEVGGKIHREFTRDGKNQLHKYVQQNAMLDDMKMVVDVIRSLRFYLALPAL